MRGTPFRGLVTASVFAVSALLLACPLGQLHLRIPDYASSQVKGVRLYRVDSGRLVDAGRLEFSGIQNTPQYGELLKYTQVTVQGAPASAWGPAFAQVIRDPAHPASIEVTLGFLNQLPPGYFKVATYNAVGTSPVSAAQAFVNTDPPA